MDAKCRVTLPADWRPTELGRILLSPHSERKCILGLPQATYQGIIDTVKAAEGYSEEDKYNFITIFSANNEPANIDAQGRISLPESLCAEYGMKKGEKVLLLGTDDRFEIYSQTEWDSRKTDAKAAFQKLSKMVQV